MGKTAFRRICGGTGNVRDGRFIMIEVIANPLDLSHAKFAKYAKFLFLDYFADLAYFA